MRLASAPVEVRARRATSQAAKVDKAEEVEPCPFFTASPSPFGERAVFPWVNFVKFAAAAAARPIRVGSGRTWRYNDSAKPFAFGGLVDMNRNCGPEDRVVRIVVAIGLAVIVYVGVLEGVAAIVAGVVAAYLLLSGLLARCIIYKMIDVDTSVQEQPYSTTDDRSGL
jgi:hypothetical protein